MRILSLILVFQMMGCASYFKRKDCESTNWFAYGETVALEGRRLTGDQFITECKQADAAIAESDLDRGFKSGLEKYCEPEVVFQTGKSGNFFTTEMCDGGGLSSLQAKHRAGVLEYCKKSNAYAAGAKGKAYNKICPSDLEAGFVPEFNRGRKKYLTTVISENEKQISQLELDQSKLQRDLDFKRRELAAALNRSQDPKVNRSNELNSEVYSLQRSLSGKAAEITRLRERNREVKLEIVQLDN